MAEFEFNEYDLPIIQEEGSEKDFHVAEDIELYIQEQNLISGCSGTAKVGNLGDVANESSALDKCFDIKNNEQITVKFDNSSSQVGFDKNHTQCVVPRVMKYKEEVVGLYECKLCELTTSDKDVFLCHFKIIHKAEEKSLAEEEKLVKSECLSNEIGTNGIDGGYNVKRQENSKEEVKPGGQEINSEAKNLTACSDDFESMILKIISENSKEYECKLCGLKTTYEDVFQRHFKIIHQGEEKLLAEKQELVKMECFSNQMGSNGNHEDYNVQCQENSQEEEVEPGGTKINSEGKNTAACSEDFESVILNIISETSKEYECKLCGLKTEYKDVFQRHFKIIHTDKKKSFQCRFCEQKFETKHNLRAHVILKHDETVYKCPFCEYKSRWQSALRNHIRYIHDEHTEQLKCELCSYTTKNKYFLKRHFKLVHGQNPELFICAFCEFKTKNKLSLKDHFKNMHASVDHFH